MAQILRLCILLISTVVKIGVLAKCHMSVHSSLWSDWWTYEGISGPRFWGLMNNAWSLCSRGKFQSPIDIKPEDLLFDPSLKPLEIRTKKISGNISNTGHDITINVDDTMIPVLNFSNGPLQYEYNLFQIKFHFGRDDSSGSEHTIEGNPFPAEIQLLAYNRDLYDNATQAFLSPKGLAIFAIFAEFGEPDNEAFRLITKNLKGVRLKDQTSRITGLPIYLLLPNTQQYITYEGSFTQPGCYESVTWVVFNRPIRILKQQLAEFRTLNQGGDEDPELLLERNYRPTMPINNRPVRTNINFLTPTKTCTMHMTRFYDVNKKIQEQI